jgi:hypothetical protein
MRKTLKDHISSRDLETCAKAASKRAVERAKALRIPYTVQEGKNIVEHRPDGSKVIIETLDNAFVRVKEKRYRIA